MTTKDAIAQLEDEWKTLRSAAPVLPKRLAFGRLPDASDDEDDDKGWVKTSGGPWDPRSDAELDSLVQLYGRYRGAALHHLGKLKDYRRRVRAAMRQRSLTIDELRRLNLRVEHATDEIEGAEKGLEYLESQYDKLYGELRGRGGAPQVVAGRVPFAGFDPIGRRQPEDADAAIQALEDSWARSLVSDDDQEEEEEDLLAGDDINEGRDALRGGFRHSAPPGYSERRKRVLGTLQDLEEFRDSIETALDRWHGLSDKQRKRLVTLLVQVKEEIEGRERGLDYLEFQIGPGRHPTPAAAKAFDGTGEPEDLDEAIEQLHDAWQDLVSSSADADRAPEPAGDRLDDLRDGFRSAPPPGYREAWKSGRADVQDLEEFRENVERALKNWKRASPQQRGRLTGLLAEVDTEMEGREKGGDYLAKRMGGLPFNDRTPPAGVRIPFRGRHRRILKYQEELEAAVDTRRQQWGRRTQYIRQREAEGAGAQEIRAPKTARGRSDFDWEQQANKMRAKLINLGAAPAASQLESTDPVAIIGVRGERGGKESLRALRKDLRYWLAVREATWDVYTQDMEEAELAGDTDLAEQLHTRRHGARENQSRKIEDLQAQIRDWGMGETSRAALPSAARIEQLLLSGASVKELWKEINKLKAARKVALREYTAWVALRKNREAEMNMPGVLPTQKGEFMVAWRAAGVEARKEQDNMALLTKHIKNLEGKMFAQMTPKELEKYQRQAQKAEVQRLRRLRGVAASIDQAQPAGVSVRKWWAKRKAKKGVSELASREQAEINQEKRRIKDMDRQIKQLQSAKKASRKKIARLQKERRKAKRVVSDIRGLGASADLTHHLTQAADLVGHPLHAGPDEDAADEHVWGAIDELHDVMRVPQAEGYAGILEDWVRGWVDAIRPRTGPTASPVLSQLGVTRADSRDLLDLRSDRVARALGAHQNSEASRAWRDMHQASLKMLDATAERHRWAAQADPAAAEERGIGASGFWTVAARPSDARFAERSRACVIEADQVEQRHAEAVKALGEQMMAMTTTTKKAGDANGRGPIDLQKYKRPTTPESLAEARRLYEEQQEQMAQMAKRGKYVGPKPKFEMELKGTAGQLLRDLEDMRPREYVELEGRRMTVQGAREWLLHKEVVGAKLSSPEPYLLRKYA